MLEYIPIRTTIPIPDEVVCQPKFLVKFAAARCISLLELLPREEFQASGGLSSVGGFPEELTRFNRVPL